MKYRAFISYSHSDTRTVSRLHRWLENYRLPEGMKMRDGTRRLAPIFRDRDELPTSADLGSHLSSALEASETLLVFCSPASAASRWVNEEAATFIRLGREDSIVAVMIDGDAQGSHTEPQSDRAHLPPALVAHVDRKRHADGLVHVDLRAGLAHRGIARLRLVAAIARVDLGSLERSHLRRSVRRAIAGGIAAVMLSAGLGGLSAWAMWTAAEARTEAASAARARDDLLAASQVARDAEATALAEERVAKDTTDFFVSMFAAPNAPRLAANLLFADVIENASRRLIANDERAPAIEDPQSRIDLLRGFSIALAHLGHTRAAADAAAAAASITSQLPTSPANLDDPRVGVILAAQTAVNANDFQQGLEYCRIADMMPRRVGNAGSHTTETDVHLSVVTAQCLLRTGGETEEIQQQLQKARDLIATMDTNTSRWLVSLLRLEALVQRERLSAPAVGVRTLREALAICAEESYPDARDWPAVAINIVECGAIEADPEELVGLAYEAQDRCRALYGEGHVKTHYAQVRLAVALKACGKYAETIKLLQPLMPALHGRQREDFDSYCLAGITLARSLTASGRLTEATPLVNALIHDYDSSRDTHSERFAEILESHTEVLLEGQRYAEAVSAANQSLTIREELFGRLSVRLWSPLTLIARCHEKTGQRKLQVATLDRLLAILEQNGQHISPEAVQVHWNLATAWAFAATTPEEAYLRHYHAFRAVDVCERAGFTGTLLADALLVKGLCLCVDDKLVADGLPLLERALQVVTVALGANEPLLAVYVDYLKRAAVAAGTQSILNEEFRLSESSPEPVAAAVTSALDTLDSTEPLGKAAAAEARVVLAEQAAQSAEGVLLDEPEIAMSLAGRGDTWLSSPTTADSTRVRAARTRLALIRVQADLIADRATVLSMRLAKEREANGLPRELLFAMAVASTLDDDEAVATELLVECDLKGRDPWPDWVAQSMAPASENTAIAEALHRLKELSQGE